MFPIFHESTESFPSKRDCFNEEEIAIQQMYLMTIPC